MQESENDKVLASFWSDFVNVPLRVQREAAFLKEHVPRQPFAFDASLGCGATTLTLYKVGAVHVVSNDISRSMIEQARQNVTRHGLGLTGYNRDCDVTRYDWRSMAGVKNNTFDLVTNLGNSLTLLPSEEDVHLALREHFRILRPGGTFVVDERNYEHHFLADETGGQFRWTGNVVYHGKQRVSASPISISPDGVTMVYEHGESNLTGSLNLLPFREGQLFTILQEVGFQHIRVFGDYKEDFNPREPEFLTYVCMKP